MSKRRVGLVAMRCYPPYAGGVANSVCSIHSALLRRHYPSTIITSNYPPVMLLRLFRSLARRELDIVHTHSSRSGLLKVTQALTKAFRCSHLHTLYGPVNGTGKHVRLALVTSGFHLSDLVMERHVDVVLPGVDMELFRRQGRSKYALAVGSNESRDVASLVLAAEVLQNLHLRLVWVVSEYKHFFHYLSHPPHPNMYVSSPDANISYLMSNARLYLLFVDPRKQKFISSLPNTLLEAYACNTPVVAMPKDFFYMLPHIHYTSIEELTRISAENKMSPSLLTALGCLYCVAHLRPLLKGRTWQDVAGDYVRIYEDT